MVTHTHETEGDRVLAIADIRDRIEDEQGAARRLFWGRVVVGIAATLVFTFYVVAGVGPPAVLLAVLFGGLTLKGIRRYRRTSRRLKALEMRLEALLDPSRVGDIQGEIEVEEGAADRVLWGGVAVAGAATAFVIPFLVAGAGLPAAVLAVTFAVLTWAAVARYRRSAGRLEDLEGRLATLRGPGSHVPTENEDPPTPLDR